MGNDNKLPPKSKKGFPGGILILFLAMVLLFLTIQSLMGGRKAKISFSHQLEHLVNLNLIEPKENKMIAENDKLVTFSGKFRAIENEDGKNRFKYLSLLNTNHQLIEQKDQLITQRNELNTVVKDSSIYYLQILGRALPSKGYVVVSPLYNTSDQQNSIIIKSLPKDDLVSLSFVEKEFSYLKSDNSRLDNFEKDLSMLLQELRSPKLGVGDETIKSKIRSLYNQFSTVSKDTKLSIENKIGAYSGIITAIVGIEKQIDVDVDGVRLLPLRSVRNYLEVIDQYSVISNDLEKNTAILDKSRKSVANVIWFFNNKEVSTKTLEKQDGEVFKHWYLASEKEWNNFALNKGLPFKAPDQPRNTVLQTRFHSQEASPNYFSFIITLLPIVVVILLLYFVFSRQSKGVGSSAMNFGKSPARLLTKETNKVTFKDVAGAEESKEELTEIVDFLKDPKKYTALGARIPKGVLLVGPPGTGKTLIAKAVAGEADRPFFSISGSDFVEMFVGVGASRVRDLFAQGKKSAPCIIFMDEIDAVGRHRGSGIGGGHDEREQTLNQLLVEMDGFDTKEGVILMAATNRPDILDKALLRPGRFDRRVVLDLPDIKGRYEILKVHARKIKIDPAVDLMDIARNTPGASGADLENILNEAALLAARKGRRAVTSQETREACDKVRFGKERRSLEMDQNEKRTTAFHESGHAIVGLSVKYCDPVDKVTIIPRGFSLGATHFLPKKNRLNYWRKEIIDQLAVLLGGRAAEEIYLEDMSSGAQQDITQATKLARAMVCEWGMSDDLGTVTYDEKSGGGEYLGMGGYHEKTYSNETAQKIDKEVKKIIDDAHKRAQEIVKTQEDKLKMMADMLMEFETLDSNDIKDIMDGTWDSEKKKKKIIDADSLQKKLPPPPPPIKDKLSKSGDEPTMQEG
jgi:cell division protease FtsH